MVDKVVEVNVVVEVEAKVVNDLEEMREIVVDDKVSSI